MRGALAGFYISKKFELSRSSSSCPDPTKKYRINVAIKGAQGGPARDFND
jgi:hypothetical protein